MKIRLLSVFCIIFVAIHFSSLVSTHASNSSGQSFPIYVRSISLFKNEIQLDIDKNKNIKVGTKISARTAVNHKCLLVVTRVVRDLAYADATLCPGYATLKKGQSVQLASEAEVNEEVKILEPRDNS